MRPCNMIRASACTARLSRWVGPGRAAPARYSGEFWCTNGNGTNSVKPPVRSWMSRSTLRWPTQCRGLSTCPYIIVDDDRRPTSCAVVTISIHIDVGNLPLVSTQRTSSSRISAAVPGMVSSPASRRLISHSRMLKPALGHAVGDLHRGERVHVHRRHPGLDGAHQVGVAGDRQLGVDAALHADLGGAFDVRLPRAVGDLVGGQRERVGVALALRERAEPAAGVADVGEVDVAVHHEGHVVADGVAAQRIRQRGNRFQRRAVGRGQRQVLVVGAAGRDRVRPSAARRARRCRCAPARAAASSCTCARIDSQSPKALSRSLRVSVLRPSVSIAALRSTRPEDSTSSGSCHGMPTGLTSRARPVAGSASATTWPRTRGSIHAAPACTYLGCAVSRCDQVVSGLGGDRGQLVQMRARAVRG